MTTNTSITRRLAPILIAVSACTPGSDDAVDTAAPTPPADATPNATGPTADPPSSDRTTDTGPTASAEPSPSTGAAGTPTTTPGPTTTTKPTPTTTTTTMVEFDRMRPGDDSPRVGVVQLKLIVLGYLPAGSDNGVYDDATTAAVRRFQTDYALFVDGVVGPQTNRSLTAAAQSVNVDG